MNRSKRTLAVLALVAAAIVGPAATSHAGTNIVPGGDGTGGGTWKCFQLTPWTPVQCIRVW